MTGVFPEHWTWEEIFEYAFAEILTNQRILLHNQARFQGEIMSKLTDFQAKLVKLQADVTAFVAANSGGASDADIDALSASVDQIDALVTPQPAPATRPPARPEFHRRTARNMSPRTHSCAPAGSQGGRPVLPKPPR